MRMTAPPCAPAGSKNTSVPGRRQPAPSTFHPRRARAGGAVPSRTAAVPALVRVTGVAAARGLRKVSFEPGSARTCRRAAAELELAPHHRKPGGAVDDPGAPPPRSRHSRRKAAAKSAQTVERHFRLSHPRHAGLLDVARSLISTPDGCCVKLYHARGWIRGAVDQFQHVPVSRAATRLGSPVERLQLGGESHLAFRGGISRRFQPDARVSPGTAPSRPAGTRAAARYRDGCPRALSLSKAPPSEVEAGQGDFARRLRRSPPEVPVGSPPAPAA